MLRRTPWTLVAVLLGLVLVGAACGSSTHPSASSAATTSTATTSTATTPTATATATSNPSAPETIFGTELRSVPKFPAATSAPPSPSPTATTVDRAFLRTVFDDAQRLWHQQFTAAGLPYHPAKLVIFTSTAHSACGSHTDVGPFYCGADRTIYLDVGFFDLLARQAGLGGFAQAYVVGHEFGHHVQHLVGIDRRVAAANQANPSGENPLSVRVELQADCLAGVWAHSLYGRGELDANAVKDKLRTAALIGDDFQARAAGRPVDPGLFTHGSSAQRQHWLTVGFESGEPGSCDTFSG